MGRDREAREPGHLAPEVLGPVARVEIVRTAPTGQAQTSSDRIGHGGRRPAVTDRGMVAPGRSFAERAPAHRTRAAAVASGSDAATVPAEVPRQTMRAGARPAMTGHSAEVRGDRQDHGETDRLLIATARSPIAIGRLSHAATGHRSNPAARSGRHSDAAARSVHSPARAATGHRSNPAARHARRHGSIVPVPRPTAGARLRLPSLARTKSSSPVAGRSRRPLRPDARRSDSLSSRSAARRSNGWCSTRRRCASRSSRLKAGH